MIALQCLEDFLLVVGFCIDIDMTARIGELRRHVGRNQGDIEPQFRVVDEEFARTFVPGHFFTFLCEDLRSESVAATENQRLCNLHVEYQISRGGRGNMFS